MESMSSQDSQDCQSPSSLPFLVINITYLYSLWVSLNFHALRVHWNSGFMEHCQHDMQMEHRNGRHGLCIPLLTCMFHCCTGLYFYFYFFFKFYFIFKLYITVLVLPNIKMNPPQVYMCSPSWTLLPPPSPLHPSGSSQCTSPKHPVSCIEPGLATHFIHDILHVSMPYF